MSLRILIVDPDKSAAEVTSAVIQRLAPDAALVIARTLDDAAARIQQGRIDVLIIDPSPYRLAGTQMLQQLRNDHPSLRMIVVASAPSSALRAKMQDLSVDGYMEKPVLLEPIAQELNSVLLGVQQNLPRPVMMDEQRR